MARPRRMLGIQVIEAHDLTLRYRGSAYVNGKQEFGPTTADAEEAIEWRRATLAATRGEITAGQRISISAATYEFKRGIADGSIRNRSGRVYKPSVVRGYQRDLEICVRIIGPSTPLDRVHVPQANALLGRLRALKQEGGRPYSDSRVRNIMMALRAMYAWAILQGLATVNPCQGLRLPISDEKRRDRIATVEEVRLLLYALEAPDKTAVALAAYAGLRAGEILALEWQDVHLDIRSIRIDRSCDHTTGEIIDVKTKAARRSIPICAPLLAILQEHQEAHNDEGALFPASRPRRGATVRPDARMAHSSLVKRLKTSWGAAGLEPLGLHEARHTFASMLIDVGATAKAICTYMGHSSITITFDRYGHLMPGNEAETRDLLDAYHGSTT